MEIRLGSLFFPELRNSGPQTAEAVIRFPRAAQSAVAGIVGYSATFQGDDHHLGRLQIELETVIDAVDPQNVVVRGTYGLRDWTNSWDDPYTGTVQFALLGELEPVTPPSPGEARPDLIVVDLEVNQVIQHFRSQFHLDAPNVFPDNSVRLVADKPTGIRVYVDYDRNSGLPVIPAITGTLDVIAGDGSAMTLFPTIGIVPLRDALIDRRISNHTLNFLVPEGLCRGLVTLRCQVRSTVDATQFSETFEKQVLFEDLPPLPVFAIGIDYTGPDVIAGSPTTAPTQIDFVATLALTELLYPIPAAALTGFQTMTYGEEVKSNLANGCEKMGDLKDTIGDLRGDSTDIFLGLLNTGVDTGSVKGCGSSGGGCVSIVNRQPTTAHEIGHVLGRQHAPCDNVGRCNRPKNTDDDYPNYAGYDSDSIGEYGFDTRNGRIKDPAVAHDFMGYSDDDWVSPYTYKALLSRIPGATVTADFAPAAAAVFDPRRREDRAEWLPLKFEQLFLNLRIHRDRRVEFKPAFHFPALPNAVESTPTPFVIEFQDEKGEVLTADCLYGPGDPCGCCGGRIWPQHIVQAVPFDKQARRLVIYEDDKPIHEQEIPAPPKLHLACTDGDQDSPADHLSFSWTAGRAGKQDGKQDDKREPRGDLWYLLQWRDRQGTWRGVMPRTRDTKAVVPKRLFGRQTRVAVRVLATSGIATGMDVWEGDIYLTPLPPHRRGPVLILQGVDAAAARSQDLPAILRMAAVDRYGVALAAPEILWFSGKGAELARGRGFDLRLLPPGRHVVRAVLLDSGAGGAVASLLIERGRDDDFRLIRGYAARD
jgi:hypothetical protein